MTWRYRLACWLLRETEYVVLSAKTLDDQIITARQYDVARIQQLEREVRNARDWAMLRCLEELGEAMYPDTKGTWKSH